ncbi:phosphoribosylamine--glycine ligase [Treponema sp. OttesenSCG-928-L16]|nr:phosphoribosylamine--glycine ligase [Treponema sp. OttesenSCG-928-L16]
MKILVIGSGGREHAICWRLAESAKVEKIYAAPGNGGTALEQKCENIPCGDPASPDEQEKLISFSKKHNIDFALIGPEAPLAAGIADRFRQAGIPAVGPEQNAARLEASKAFSKAFMEKYGIRAAGSETFSDHASALVFTKKHFAASEAAPLVIKADGLAAGKGVVIAESLKDAEEVLLSFMKDKSLGDAGSSVVLEEFLKGKEVSILAAVSVSPGKKGCILPFISARDHKRRFDGGRGPNTGGMGAISPVPDFSEKAMKDFRKSIMEPSLRGMEEEKMDYRGFIFFGLMVDDDQCRLLEYNVRLGDPETQAVLPLMDFDFAGLCLAVIEGTLDTFPQKWKSGAVCAPVAVAEGYPGPYRQGDLITIDQEALKQTGAKLFIAGAGRERKEGKDGLYTSGGRVLSVSAWGKDSDEAWEKAYKGLGALAFKGMAYRRDIGREEPMD